MADIFGVSVVQLITILLILATIVLLYIDIFPILVVFLSLVSLFVIFGILDARDVLSGFANEQVAVILLLLVISYAVKKTELLSLVFEKCFNGERSGRGFLAKMMLIVSVFSSFLNNTPIVALFMSYVHDWGKRHDVSPSKLLIPLSYAAVLGGTATLIGTSTNLIVNGLAIDKGMQPLGIFDFSIVGVPLVIIGIVYFLVWGFRVLPDNKDLLADFTSNPRSYVVEAEIEESSSYVGKTVEEAGLKSMEKLYLVEVIRGRRGIAYIEPDFVLRKGDKLLFAGDTESIIELLKKSKGLKLAENKVVVDKEHIHVAEVVVSRRSSLHGQSVKESRFRSRFFAGILAVYRDGKRMPGRIGKIVLRHGDVLLVTTSSEFWNMKNIITDFYVISRHKPISKFSSWKIAYILGGTFFCIFLSIFSVVSLFKSLFVLVTSFMLLKVITFEEVKKNIDVNIILVAAFALAVGKAMLDTGVADLIGSLVISVFEPMGLFFVLLGIYLITNILTEVVTNAAAASISFPIAFSMALSLGVDAVPFVLVVAFAASASFMTPVGYQTNLMIYGPGGYKFKDYIKVGLPLSLVYMIVCVSVLYGVYL